MVICRCLPHGYYCTIITLIVTVGFIISTIENSIRTCHYSIVSESTIIQQLTQTIYITPSQQQQGTNSTNTNGTSSSTGSNIIVPYIQVGYNSYRIPTFYASTNTWIFDDNSYKSSSKSSSACIAYPKSFTLIDNQWKVAQYCKYIALILGGSATIYLWCLMILPINKCSWRFIAIELLVACIIQLLSLIWFRTNICTSNINTNTTNNNNSTNEFANSFDNNNSTTTSYQFEQQQQQQQQQQQSSDNDNNNVLNGTFLNNLETVTTNMITTSTCTVSIGAKFDIYSAIIWLVGSILLCMYFPQPRHMKNLNDNSNNSTNTDNDTDNASNNNNTNTSDGLIIMVNQRRTRRYHRNNTNDSTSIGHSTVTRSMNTTSTCLRSTYGQNGGDFDDNSASLRSIQTNFTTKYPSTRTRLDSTGSTNTSTSNDIA